MPIVQVVAYARVQLRIALGAYDRSVRHYIRRAGMSGRVSIRMPRQRNRKPVHAFCVYWARYVPPYTSLTSGL